mmetsp:Transcript_75485/g.208273  ORF Transcript_75485/g.208273 Transcript_75485/m.208273 type:complete len:342 (-) Transcript_75485:158-1183(-)
MARCSPLLPLGPVSHLLLFTFSDPVPVLLFLLLLSFLRVLVLRSILLLQSCSLLFSIPVLFLFLGLILVPLFLLPFVLFPRLGPLLVLVLVLCLLLLPSALPLLLPSSRVAGVSEIAHVVRRPCDLPIGFSHPPVAACLAILPSAGHVYRDLREVQWPSCTDRLLDDGMPVRQLPIVLATHDAQLTAQVAEEVYCHAARKALRLVVEGHDGLPAPPEGILYPVAHKCLHPLRHGGLDQRLRRGLHCGLPGLAHETVHLRANVNVLRGDALHGEVRYVARLYGGASKGQALVPSGSCARALRRRDLAHACRPICAAEAAVRTVPAVPAAAPLLCPGTRRAWA